MARCYRGEAEDAAVNSPGAFNDFFSEDGEGEDAFTESTLTEAARERLYDYADAVDEACEELDD